MPTASPLLAVAAVLLATACHSRSTAQDAHPVAPKAVVPASGVSASKQDIPRNPDMTDFASEVDKNGDGRMSRAEWQAEGLPESSFNMFERGRGYVTLADYQSHPAPPGIDMNGDGKVTVAEFKAFDKQMSARMGSGKAPPPRP